VLIGPQQQAFDKIKEELTSSISLAHHDPGCPIIKSCDASDIGIRSVLPCNLLWRLTISHLFLCWAPRTFRECHPEGSEVRVVYVTGKNQMIADSLSGVPGRKQLPAEMMRALLVRLSRAYLQPLHDFKISRRHKIQMKSITRSRSPALKVGPTICQIHPFCEPIGKTKVT